MASFGTTSLKHLDSSDYRLRIICNDAIKILNFSVVSGHRTKEEQNALYPEFTQVKWPDSKHNTNPSVAIDVAPFIPPYGVITGSPQNIEKIMELSGKSKAEAEAFVLKSYGRLVGVIQAVAAKHYIEVRFGMDWDGDEDLLDQTFHDLGHVELT